VIRALLVLAACGGTATDTAETAATDTDSRADTGIDTAADGDTAAPPTFAADVGPLFERRCARCHADFGGTEAYDAIVDARSDEAPHLALVAPGDLDGSYLWHKVNGSQQSAGGSGAQMPKDRALPAGDRALVQRWIEGGAPR
jgi:hypothetical protein